MKTRIVHTKIWQDDFFCSLGRSSKLLFMYLLTSQYNNLSGIFEISDRTICFDTSLTSSELKEAKKELVGKVVFTQGWVKILNSERYSKFEGEKNEKAKENELKGVPNTVLAELDTLSVEYPGSSATADTPNNQKSVISNQKPEKEIKNKEKDETTQNGQQLLEKYNSIFGKNLKSTHNFEDNLAYWLKTYTLEDMYSALGVAVTDEYWKNIITPEILLRVKDQKQNDVDRISQFLAKAHTVQMKPKTNILKMLEEKGL